MFFSCGVTGLPTMGALAGWIHQLDLSFRTVNVMTLMQNIKLDRQMTVSDLQLCDDCECVESSQQWKRWCCGEPRNVVHVESSLRVLRDSGYCIVVTLMISEEAFRLFNAACDMGMVKGRGWMWCGTDGINGGRLAGLASRLKYFAGII